MVERLKYFTLRELSNTYYSRWIVVSQLFSVVVTLILYWFTAKAFKPEFEMFGARGSDYFTFLVIGEATLAVPLFLFGAFVSQIRQSVSEGTFEVLMVQPRAIELSILNMGIAASLFAVLKVFLSIAMAELFFDLDILNSALMGSFVLQLACWPFFIGFGLLAGAGVVVTGRGEGILGELAMVIMLVSGAYFPTQVFPEFFHSLISKISPFNWILLETRIMLSEGWRADHSLYVLIGFLLLGAIVLPLGIFGLRQAMAYRRRCGTPLIFTR